MSMAWTRPSRSHSVPNGLRYSTSYRRPGPVVSWRLAEPFGHSRPRLTGEAGSPSIWVTRPPATYTFWPQPTAQYGQTDLTTASAVSVRGASRRTARMIAIVVSFPELGRPLTPHCGVRQTGCPGLVSQHRALFRAGPAPDAVWLPGRQREGQALAAYLAAGADRLSLGDLR